MRRIREALCSRSVVLGHIVLEFGDGPRKGGLEMRKCFDGWRPIVGMAAVGALAFSIMAYGAPNVQQAPISVKEGLVSVDLDAPAYTHLVVTNTERGGGAGIPPIAGVPVYAQYDTCGRGHFFNDDYTFGYGAWWAQARFDCPAGFPLCDARGWTSGDDLTGYEVSSMFCSSASANNCSWVTELWDGDPLWVMDTVCNPTPGPIPGTKATFENLARAGLHNLRVQFETPITYNCDRVWIAVSQIGGCRGSWLLGGQPPATCTEDPADIGWGDGYGALWGCQAFGYCATPSYYNAGTCCTAGGACDYTGWPPDTTWTGDCLTDAGAPYPMTCPVDCWGYFTHPTFCSDGGADYAFWGYNYAPYGYYYAQPGMVYGASDIYMIWQPVSAGAPPPGSGTFTISGNEISMPAGGTQVWLEERVTPVGAINVKAWQGDLTSEGYTNNFTGTMTPYSPDCTVDADCEALLGPLGSGGAKGGCGVPGVPAGKCAAGFINNDRTDYLFNAKAELPAVDLSTIDYRYGSTLLGAPFPAPDYETYLGSLVLDMTADARGTFYVGFNPLPSQVADEFSIPVPMMGFVPGLITVTIGKCCYDIAGPSPGCAGGEKPKGEPITQADCDAMPGKTQFTPDVYCTGNLAVDCPVCLNDTQCPDNDACTVDTCVAGACVHTPVVVAAGDCCDWVAVDHDADINGLGNMAPYDDGIFCTYDYCSKGTTTVPGDRGLPLNAPKPTSVLCEADDDPCNTPFDHCDGAGACVVDGLVSDIFCLDDTMCDPPAVGATCNVAENKCRCVLPSLNFAVGPGAKPNPNCFLPGDKVAVDVFFKSAPVPVNGAQFVVLYDPSCLQFNSISPGDGANAYTFEIEEIVDEAEGMIFYAVGVSPMGGMGVAGTAVVATINFTKMGGCTECALCFGGENPMNPALVDNMGQSVPDLETYCSKDIIENDVLWLEVPRDMKLNVDCDKTTAMVGWDEPTAGSNCYAANLDCWGQHESGLDMTACAMGGPCEHPQGVTTYGCVVTSKVCGDWIDDSWTVTVNDLTSLDVEIQLSPIIVGDLVRCIKFELFSDCVQPPLVFQQDILFGGLFDHIAHFTDIIKIPGKGQWKCITARDQLHTLRACAWLECVDGVYYAIFKGDPFHGGNWLIGGNLDGFKKGIIGPSHDVIDIMDFGMFVGQWGRIVNPNTICKTDGPHADINGDGIVDALDFTFIMMNFLESSKECCCPDSTAGTIVGRTEISVRELREMGLGELAVGDLNRDGLLNMDDVEAFQAGGMQPVKGSRDRSGMSR